jgi:hypothetical protein
VCQMVFRSDGYGVSQGVMIAVLASSVRVLEMSRGAALLGC